MLVTQQFIDRLTETSINIYRYGSTVYGTAVNGISDEDFVCVVPDNTYDNDSIYECGNQQYIVYSQSAWRQMLEDNCVCAVECMMLPEAFIVKSGKQDNTLFIDKQKIRAQFSATASNSWVKCKKKLMVDFAPRTGKKSLWHSLRILMFGIQILQYGTILHYDCANEIYPDIVENKCNDWVYYKTKYQPLYNSLKSEFRRLG